MERVVHTQRFEVVRRLGAGATGVVYEACNRRSGERVALKALARLDASSLYRFKREFRALAGVSHPNLVTLKELFHESGQWYLSMELVHGRSFVEYVRHQGAADIARLRAALAQLVRALHALHEAGRLHRDIKPSNVLVTEQGRVVVLDFGFVRELDAEPSAESMEIVGTPVYMAPEQAELGGAVPESDWYAVGVMLFEALTGRLPYLSATLEPKSGRTEHALVRASMLEANLPPDLDQLCSELVARDPRKRPTGRALLERVGGVAPERRAPRKRSELFVGRKALLEQLYAAHEEARSRGEPRLVCISGASAMGKTALLEQFGAELAEASVWTLFGRCHERENVPYKALDGVVDALVRRMGELDDEALARLVPRHLGALTLQFPVLLRVAGLARFATRYVRPADPHELRRHASAALKELLSRIADHHPLVLLIDDLQWGDVDSVHMLRDALLTEDAGAITLVVAQRNDERVPSPALAAFREATQMLARGEQLLELALPPLSEGESVELARMLLGPLAQGDLLGHVVRESERVPLFIHELARHVIAGGGPHSTLGELFAQRLDRLSSEARALLELIAVACAPVPVDVARKLAGESFDRSVTELMQERLVLMSVDAGEHLDTRHDRIRVFIRGSLPNDRAAQHHLTLARQLAAHGAEPELLSYHFSSAGDPTHAATYAARAAEAASRALAFTSAARCYELALAWGTFSPQARSALLVSRAEALANAGRGRDSAQAYLAAAEHASGLDRCALRSRAVDQYLRAGCIEPGLEIGDVLLADLGLARAETGVRALAALVARRSWLLVRNYAYAPKRPSSVDPRALMRVEAARSMSLALGHMDPFAAANMQARHMILALRSGDTFAVARALGYEAVYLAIEGSAHSERALAMVERQGALMVEPRHVYLRAFGHYARGVVEWGRGEWGPALTCLDAAEAAYRGDCLGVDWEILAAQLFALGSLLYLGRYDELAKRVVRAREEALARDDRLTLQWLSSWQAIVDVVRGELASATHAVCDARGRLPENRYTLPHLFALIASTAIDLYAGDARAAYTRLKREWPAIKRGQLLRLQVYRIELLRLRTISALALAAVTPYERSKLHAHVERDVQAIEREQVAWGRAVALSLRGELQRQQGSIGLALATLDHAEEALRATNMEGHAASVRRVRGMLLGGLEGRELVGSADTWSLRRGIRNPHAAARLTFGALPDDPAAS
jgi:eukaryotic-like serine/threonine-protein kinase